MSLLELHQVVLGVTIGKLATFDMGILFSIYVFSNNRVSFQRVHLDIQVGEHAIDYANVAQKEKLSELQLRVRQLLDQVEQITKEQNYQRVSCCELATSQYVQSGVQGDSCGLGLHLDVNVLHFCYRPNSAWAWLKWLSSKIHRLTKCIVLF